MGRDLTILKYLGQGLEKKWKSFHRDPSDEMIAQMLAPCKTTWREEEEEAKIKEEAKQRAKLYHQRKMSEKLASSDKDNYDADLDMLHEML